MALRATTKALLALLAAAALVTAAGAAVDRPPTLDLENRDAVAYEVTAVTVDDRRTAMNVNFRVTERDGDRRLATLSQMVWPGEYSNVTLADDVPSQQFRVDPGENRTVRVSTWEPGDVTVYVAQEAGGGRNHTATRVITCPDRGQEHTLTLSDGLGGGGHVCASGVDWLLP